MDNPAAHSLFLDTSAILALITNGPARSTAVEALSQFEIWCASEIALVEGVPAIDRLTDERVLRSDLEDGFRLVWDWLYTVPVDRRCIDEATHLARDAAVRTSDAIHFAAARRLPAPVSFMTFDPAQIGLAERFGFATISA